MSDSSASTPPVLLLAFNRPDLLRRVFLHVRAARPNRLFLAVDGPRENHPGDAALCAQCHAVAREVDWPCEVHTRFLERNDGCKFGVSGAISWFFETVEEGIILEEDCVPHASFFPYCAAMLARYRDDARIGLVSGNNFTPRETWSERGHAFTAYTFIWGWASWRRAWRNFDRDMVDWPERRAAGWVEKTYPFAEEADYWRRSFDFCEGGRRYDSWAFPWTYSCRKAGMLCVIPACNLVSNVGFDERGTHTTQGDGAGSLSVGNLLDPDSGPVKVATDAARDEYLVGHCYGVRRRGAGARLSRWLRTKARELGWWLVAHSGGRRRSLRGRVALLKLQSAGRRRSGEVKWAKLCWRFADGESFAADFERIWMNGRYDFTPRTASPRIIDCGAGVGVATLAWKRRIAGAEIVAVEADRVLFGLLERNVKAAGVSGVTLLNRAVARGGEPARFLPQANGRGRVVTNRPRKTARNLVDVAPVGLGELLAGGDVELLKLSIEGAEQELLALPAGALRAVARVFVEFLLPLRSEQNLDELLALFRREGFRVHVQAEDKAARPFILRGEDEGTLQRVQVFAYRR